MDPIEILSVLSALAAAVWSVWTWSEQQKKERQLKRDQEAALYVNSLLLALGELQSRLYSILEGDELAFYKKKYPDKYEFGSPAAIEILYRFGLLFGWGYQALRYGPYTRDPKVIELFMKIGETFDSRSKFPGGAFSFSSHERASLGNAVVRRLGEVTAVLPVFEAIPLYQFEKELSDEQSKHAPLYQSKVVRSTLSAIDRADKAEALEGRERLAVLQNLFLELLSYLESKEGFSVSIGEMRNARLIGDHSLVCPTERTIVRVLHHTRGRIRLGVQRLKTDTTYANRLQSLLGSIKNVTGIRINIGAASVVIRYNPDIRDAEFARAVVKTPC